MLKEKQKLSDFQLQRYVIGKDQQRLLSSQPFSRKRAFLDKQNRGRKLMQLELDNITGTSILQEQPVTQFSRHSHQQKLIESKPKDILNRRVERVFRQIANRQRVSTQYTKTDAVQVPQHAKTNSFLSTGVKQSPSDNTKPRYRTEMKQKNSFSHGSSMPSTQGSMVKIRSRKSVLKVWNPFPFFIAEMS